MLQAPPTDLTCSPRYGRKSQRTWRGSTNWLQVVIIVPGTWLLPYKSCSWNFGTCPKHSLLQSNCRGLFRACCLPADSSLDKWTKQIAPEHLVQGLSRNPAFAPHSRLLPLSHACLWRAQAGSSNYSPKAIQ